MANLSGFDASKVEPAGVFEALPAGEYQAFIVESENKPTKNGDGEYLQLKLQIADGRYQNRTLFDRLNLKNKSEQAVTIARGTLSAICRSVGVMTPRNSEELHNKRMTVVVKTEKDKNTGEIRNRIAGYKPKQSSKPQTIVDNVVYVEPEEIDVAPW